MVATEESLGLIPFWFRRKSKNTMTIASEGDCAGAEAYKPVKSG
jgi:hypothetical protein